MKLTRSIKQGAHVKYESDKGFLFDEEKLRKINDIISKRISNTLEFFIFREDSYSYKTTNLEDIINEDNLKWARINEIDINVENEDFDLSLEFNEKGTLLQINGSNRDDVFLLFSELKEYLSNEVCSKGLTSKFILDAIPALAFIILLGVIVIDVLIDMGTPKFDEQLVSNLMQSNEINEKINFLIQFETKSNDTRPNIVIISLLPFLLIGIVFRESLTKFVLYFYPTNLFLFGKEIDRYKKRLDIRSKLFWVILIGTIVSIVGGILVWRIIPN